MAAILATVVTLIVLPARFITSVWRARDPDRLTWLGKSIYCVLFLGYLFEVGRWDFISVYFRPVLAAACAAALLRGFLVARAKTWIAPWTPARTWTHAVTLALVVFFGSCYVWAASARLHDGPSVAMRFPLEGGRFYVGQGGSRTLMNYHHGTQPQRYALDIHELNAAGMRASGPFPDDLHYYAIFGQPVVSPCTGRVVTAVDQFPDLPPGQSDRNNVAGNHAVIACEDLLVLLAHLRSGSLRVHAGESIRAGALLGEVGNSGNTSEPHLHFHAVDANSGDALTGKGVRRRIRNAWPQRCMWAAAVVMRHPQLQRLT